MFPIYDLPWEAAATLITGVLAVGAATAVGLGQLAVSRRIARLEALRWKEALFDRRFAFILDFDDFVLPKLRGEAISEEREREMRRSFKQAEFLFSDRTVALILTAQAKLNEFEKHPGDAALEGVGTAYRAMRERAGAELSIMRVGRD